MKRFFLLIGVCIFALTGVYAQESNDYKYVAAKSILNEKMPDWAIKQWVTEKPDTVGKFILLDFWGTWCHACLKAVPRLNEIQKKYKDQLVVIGINDESLEKVKPIHDKFNMQFANGLDSTRTLRKTLKVKGFPHTLLIDPHGIVRFEGYMEELNHELTDEKIDILLKKYK
ncbi:MAG: TlpA disulfide reductase family protein [Odoribacter sp.]